MRKRVTIHSTKQSARSTRDKELAASLNGKGVAGLKPGELQSLVEYLARLLNLVDEEGLLAIPQDGQTVNTP